MNAFIDEYQYVVAWLVYLLAGFAFCVFWWRVTRMLGRTAWRDLLRGLALACIFTPWFTGDSHEHMAPAFVVVAMDFLLGSSDNGVAGSIVLLVATALMLLALLVRRKFAAKSVARDALEVAAHDGSRPQRGASRPVVEAGTEQAPS